MTTASPLFAPLGWVCEGCRSRTPARRSRACRRCRGSIWIPVAPPLRQTVTPTEPLPAPARRAA